MYLIEKATERRIAAELSIVNERDYQKIERASTFGFDWRQESVYEVWKLVAPEWSNDILGLISLIDYPEELRVHGNLIEVATPHVGKSKQLDRIAGCLIAKGCIESFRRRYFGFFSVIPKTLLIDHYQDLYGFRQFGRQLAVQLDESKTLVKEYLPNEKIF